MNNKKVLIIGIDGVPYKLINTYISKGYLPNLKEIISKEYRSHQMNATIPDISSVSWASFSTGVNPGEHGIYGFLELEPNSYSLYFPNAAHIKAPSFWDMMGDNVRSKSSLYEKYKEKIKNKYRSVIINIPHTYPVSSINGIIISGFVSIDFQKSVYPVSNVDYLNSINYKVDVDSELGHSDIKKFLENLFSCFESRKKAVNNYFDKHDWDIFAGIITESDRLMHFLFNNAYDENGAYYEEFIKFYKLTDKFIGELYGKFIDKYKDNGFFMILSDHGFTEIKNEVYLNTILQDEGYLNLNENMEYFEQIDKGTKAFCMAPGRIYFNYKDKYPRGTIKEKHKNDLEKELIVLFDNLKDNDNEKVIDKVYTKEDIYSGPYCDNAPDLVCIPKDGFDLKGALGKKDTFSKGLFSGMHNWYDAFCVLPETIKMGSKPVIYELTDIILNYMTEGE